MSQDVSIVALYKFVNLPHYESLREPIYEKMRSDEIYGTLLLAKEGINGTIAAESPRMPDFLKWLDALPGLDHIESKTSVSEFIPFKRPKVKLKQEIVSMGVDGIDPRHVVGTYVEPSQWNALISDPDVLLIDTRNDYEYAVGTFNNAINPETTNFREFPDYVAQNLDPSKHKKVAMFCTGGIRCEKSTALLKQKGFDQVYHLKGGILKYLEDVPKEQSMWQGECFVFDERVTVDHDLQKGQYDQCYACRRPISKQDQQSQKYVKGVSCPYCFDEHTQEDRERFAQRQKQIELAKKRGEAHIGPGYKMPSEQHSNN